MKKSFVAMLMTGVLTLGISVAAATAGSGDDVASACSSCHNLKRVCRMIGSKNKAGWEKTISRMIKAGAAVSPAKVGPFAGYLANQKPGTGPVCQ